MSDTSQVTSRLKWASILEAVIFEKQKVNCFRVTIKKKIEIESDQETVGYY